MAEFFTREKFDTRHQHHSSATGGYGSMKLNTNVFMYQLF